MLTKLLKYSFLLAFLVVIPSVSEAALTDNDIGYWKLDEASGNASDATGNGWTMTNENTVSYGSAVINNGATGMSVGTTYRFFDNASSLGLDGTTNFTWSGWINVTTAPSVGASEVFFYTLKGASSAQGILYSFFYTNTAGTYYLQMNRLGSATNYIKYATTLTTGTWYHVALTYDGVNIYLYLNGTLVDQTSASGYGVVTSNPSTTNFGQGRITGEDPFYGKIDEYSVWNRALSGTEISQLYNSGAGLQYPFTLPNLGYYYLFGW